MFIQPYNVSLSTTTQSNAKWQQEAPCWDILRTDAGASADFNALTIKARYVTGIILGACRSVNFVLDTKYDISTTFYPAYAVFASAVDLLGRCLSGDDAARGRNNDNLRAGFKWLHTPDAASYPLVQMSDILVTTPNGPHSIEEMYNLRQFAAHGQATYKSVHRNVTGQAINRPENCPIKDLDYLILGELPTLMGAALERYLTELKLNDALAVKLADAGVTAFSARPLFDSMGNFPADTDVYPVAIGDAIRGMDWTYNPTFTSI